MARLGSPLSLLPLLGLLCATTATPSHAQPGNGLQLTVNTAQGPVVGTRPYNTVRQWLGVPFATANRWEPPSPPPVRSTPLSASSFGTSCPQLIGPVIAKYLEFAHQDEAVTEGEDCLTVNIWSPSHNRLQNNPVLVWIYGGGFQFGASALKVYNGKELVKNNDITVVSFNYRLNIFGQPNAPQLVNATQSQNFGLLDQRAAIQWVYDNIANFGGDPNKITIAGHSAGGTSAGIYTLSYPTDTIVKGIIEQSGGLYGLADQASPTLDSATWNNVADAVGCGNSPTPTQFTCMKAKPWADLITAANNLGVIFFLLVTDEILIFSDYEARMNAGNFLKVPTLAGNVANEGDGLTVALNVVLRGNAPPFLTGVIADISTQVGGTCPTSKESKQRFDQSVPVWRYRYQATFPHISSRQDLRAFHGSDIPIAFGTYNAITSTPEPDATEQALSTHIQNAWTAFVSNPTSGLNTFGWTAYNPAQETLNLLGDRANRVGVSLGSPARLDATCADIPKLFELNMEFQALLSTVP